MKRQRGRGRKPGGGHHSHGGGGNSPHRSLETNGPDTKFRGTASFIHERYLQLARDAASSGDRVLSENYLQHADHYFRLVRQMQPAQPIYQPGERNGPDADADDDSDEAPEAAAAGEATGDVDGAETEGSGAPAFDREAGGDFRRRRGRRSRYRPDGEEGEGAEARDASADRQERGERPPRRERHQRNEDDNGGQEGFAVGPKPAFLRD